MRILDNSETAEWLDEAWREAVLDTCSEPDPEIDIIQNSGYVSIRYVLVTQLLGKFADGRRDALCLQRGSSKDAAEEGRWDPRGFCSRWLFLGCSVLTTSWELAPIPMSASRCAGGG